MNGVDIGTVRAAAERLRGVVVRTPLLEDAVLGARLGARVFIKPESLQRTGSFKFRGAHNRISQLTDAEREAGIVAWSSGNHAQGVAAAANMLGVPAAVVMPADAPPIKIANTRGWGAEVVTYDRWTQSREEIGAAIAKERGAVIVPPYDDPHIISGQGTTGLEVAEQAEAAGVRMDAVLVSCSGGGLAAGVATAIDGASPGTETWSVEPAGLDDLARSLAAGERMRNAPDARSICDALLAPTPGEITFPINRALLKGGLAVSDADVLAAMRHAFNVLKLVVEPGGAAPLAALLGGAIDVKGKTVCLVLSGGNADPTIFARVLSG